MAVTVKRFNIDPPVRAPLVTLGRTVTSTWQSLFSEISRFIGLWTVVIDDAYDPPNIAAGATQAVTFALKGVKPGDFLRATHSMTPWQVRVDAVCDTPDVVTVRFQNLDVNNAINPPTGVLRIEWRAR